MNNEDFFRYLQPAVLALFGGEGLGSNNGYTNVIKLDRMLGFGGEYTRYYNRGFDDDFPMPPAHVEILKKLSGPHAKTILRAYRIQRGLEMEHERV